MTSKIALAVALALDMAASADAVELRSATGRYQVDLGRGYAECTVPNDVSVDGIPACSPPVTSACDFHKGSIQIRLIHTTADALVEAALSDVTGPASCAAGPYTAAITLRATAEDASCLGGECTFEDLPLSLPLVDSGHGDFEADAQLSGLFPGVSLVASYEIVSARVVGPDGLPVAAAAIDKAHGANGVFGASGPAYEGCTAPDTSGALGAACSSPTWPATCDFSSGRVRWALHFSHAYVEPLFTDLVGTAPECRDGTYQVESVVRITSAACGGGTVACTLVDTPIVASAPASHGAIDDVSVPLSEAGITVEPDTLEVRTMHLREPSGATLAASAVAVATRLDEPRVTVGRRALDVATDDLIRVEGRLPLLSIDPTEPPGVTVTVNDRSGVFYTVTIGNGLWQLAQPIGQHWFFKDKSGGLGGVRKASIKTFKQSGSLAGYVVKLVAKDLDLSGADLPVVTLDVAIAQQGGFATFAARGARSCRVSARTMRYR